MKFWLKDFASFAWEWARYSDTEYKKCTKNLSRAMLLFEQRLLEMCLDDIRAKKIKDEQTIIWTVKYFSQEIIREAIEESGNFKNNQIKWISNRFYVEQYDMLNNICNKILSTITNHYV